MKKIKFIKPSYSNKNIRKDLMDDALQIFARNYASTLGKPLNKKDVKDILLKFKQYLYEFNDLDIDFDLTS
jgi:hypothetical protein